MTLQTTKKSEGGLLSSTIPAQQRKAAWTLSLLLAVTVAWTLWKPANVDFRVYWYGISGFLSGARPLYGPTSGIGWPQLFRYPPIFAVLFYPLAVVPFGAASAIWTVLQGAALAALTAAAIARWRLRFTLAGVVLTALLLSRFLVLSLRYGNAQWLVVSGIFAALLYAELRPWLAGSALAVAIGIKIWPIVFLPWLFRKERRKALAATMLASIALWVLPAAAFGPARYGSLLQQWFGQEYGVNSGVAEIWYPSQSLRGVLLRYLTPVDRSAMPDKDYPAVNFVSWSPAKVVWAWYVLSATAYGAAVVCMWRASPAAMVVWDALAFLTFSVLQPYCHKSSLISIWPALLVAGSVFSASLAKDGLLSKRAFLIAAVIALVPICFQVRSVQRTFDAIGLDFFLMLAVTACLAGARSTDQLVLTRAPAD